MRGNARVKCALAGVAIAALLAVGYVSVGYAAPAGAAASAGPTDTEPPPDTTPAPDPAPPAKPAPKPAGKPAPKPAAPRPAHVYHAPVQHSTPAQQPTYTPPAVVHHSTKKVVHHARRHKRRHKPKPVGVAPKAHQVKHAAVVNVAAVPTATTTSSEDAVRRSLIIAGVGIAAILFLLVVAVPSTAARFTPPGRVLMDHQTDVVLAGVGVLVLTALLFAITGNG